MRISDWSSDVCSSDLLPTATPPIITRRKAMAFELPPLPYDYGALEPTINEETMKLHHDKHHAAYTSNLNAGVTEGGLEGKSIEDILGQASKVSATVRNNGGGFWNHDFFWQIMEIGRAQ